MPVDCTGIPPVESVNRWYLCWDQAPVQVWMFLFWASQGEGRRGRGVFLLPAFRRAKVTDC